MLPEPSTGSGETWNLGFETPHALDLPELCRNSGQRRKAVRRLPSRRNAASSVARGLGSFCSRPTGPATELCLPRPPRRAPPRDGSHQPSAGILAAGPDQQAYSVLLLCAVIANRFVKPSVPRLRAGHRGDALESRSGRWSRRQRREFHIKSL